MCFTRTCCRKINDTNGVKNKENIMLPWVQASFILRGHINSSWIIKILLTINSSCQGKVLKEMCSWKLIFIFLRFHDASRLVFWQVMFLSSIIFIEMHFLPYEELCYLSITWRNISVYRNYLISSVLIECR